MGFEIIFTNDFNYKGATGKNGTNAKEVIMFHPRGLLYYATSYQDGIALGKNTDVKRSELYFQAISLKPGITDETVQLLDNKGSATKLRNGAIFKNVTNIKNSEIRIILENCEFAEEWSSNKSFVLLNEADVYQNIDGQVMMLSDIDENAIHLEKVKQFPEVVQQYLGYGEQLHR